MSSEERYESYIPLGISPCFVLNYIYVGFTLSLSNPIDFIRFRMQTMPELISQGQLQRPYRSIIDCAHRVRAEEGASAFWKGNLTNLLKFYPSEALNWGFKELFQSLFLQPTHSSLQFAFAKNYLSGALAGLFTRTILYPLEFARNRMNNSIHLRKNIFAWLGDTVRTQGITGIYRGALVSFVGVTVFRSTYFGIFDTFKSQMKDNISKWFLSYCSVFCAILLTYPSDTVRRRMMLMDTKQEGFLKCAEKIYRHQGVKGYFRGGSVIGLQSITSATIYFVFDKIIRDIKDFQ